MSTDALVFSA